MIIGENQGISTEFAKLALSGSNMATFTLQSPGKATGYPHDVDRIYRTVLEIKNPKILLGLGA